MLFQLWLFLGLNLGGNPIQFPPQHIVSQGVNVILSYLYQEFQNRSAQHSRAEGEPFLNIFQAPLIYEAKYAFTECGRQVQLLLHSIRGTKMSDVFAQ